MVCVCNGQPVLPVRPAISWRPAATSGFSLLAPNYGSPSSLVFSISIHGAALLFAL